MNFIENKIYEYREIADMIAEKVSACSYKIIAVTGMSSVGKTTFTEVMKKALEQGGYSAQVIMADNYLKPIYRAGTKFWNQLDSHFLKPEHFDWHRLQETLEFLTHGHSIEQECYVRGIGWGPLKKLEPSDYIIVEGLFLDSLEVSGTVTFDLLISLTAEDDLIRELRTERDAFYRRTSPTFTRTEAETQIEIENTLLAGKSYEICPDFTNCLQLKANGAYSATVRILH